MAPKRTTGDAEEAVRRAIAMWQTADKVSRSVALQMANCEAPAPDLFGELHYRPAMGTGFWVRGCSEPLLIATRGNVSVPEPEERMLGLLAQRTQHSRKPESVYELAERHPGPYLELFARGKARAGWAVWGNEAEEALDLQAICAEMLGLERG